jgi:molybdate transport system regulatory protein
VEKDGELYLGWGRIILLERIKELGSIAAAARSMKLGYRNAWLWIEAMNRLAPVPLVEKGAGGDKGGHAKVTEEGQKSISRYEELRKKFQEFVKQPS